MFTQQILFAQIDVAPLEPRLTQYMLHQPFINPASIGSYETFTAAMSYRNQWVGMDGTPNTQGLDFTMPINDVNFIGAAVARDYLGEGYAPHGYYFNINYAFKLQLTEADYLSLGLSAGGNYIITDLSGLEGIAIDDPALTGGSESVFSPNMRLGAYYFRDRVYAGFTLSNLFSTTTITNPDYTKEQNTEYFNMDKVNYMAHAGVSVPIGEYWDIDMSTLGRYAKGTKVQVDLNALFVYDNFFGIGATYRTSNEVALMANFRFLDHFRLGYAYEALLSDLDNSNSGTHEIMLIFQLASPKGTAIMVPRF